MLWQDEEYNRGYCPLYDTFSTFLSYLIHTEETLLLSLNIDVEGKR